MANDLDCRQMLRVPEDELGNSDALGLPNRLAKQRIRALAAFRRHQVVRRFVSNFAVRPNVFVSVVSVDEEEETFPIYVLGRVNDPGLREVEFGTTLLQAIALGGGLDRFAATKRIQLRRTDSQTGQERLFIFNFRAVERGGAIESMITLREGDVILVPERRLFE